MCNFISAGNFLFIILNLYSWISGLGLPLQTLVHWLPSEHPSGSWPQGLKLPASSHSFVPSFWLCVDLEPWTMTNRNFLKFWNPAFVYFCTIPLWLGLINWSLQKEVNDFCKAWDYRHLIRERNSALTENWHLTLYSIKPPRVVSLM